MISIIIPNYNGAELLRKYLPKLQKTLADHHMVVVDDGSSDGSCEMLARLAPSVHLVRRLENGGFSAAVNDGIRNTEGDLIVLLNNDVEVTEGFLDPIIPMFDDETVFAVSPRILLPGRGEIDEGCKTGVWHRGLFYVDQRQAVTETTPTLYVTGCAAVYRRSMLEALGGFSEAYSPFYWEDADLGYRAWKRGWKSIYQPSSTVYHQHSASISKMNSARTARVKARNSLLFIWRNIEDRHIISRHKRWLPLVLAKRAMSGDKAFVLGWRDAFSVRNQSVHDLRLESRHRVHTDSDIFAMTGVRT
jgi:GT2 family glycosyltransferase